MKTYNSMNVLDAPVQRSQNIGGPVSGQEESLINPSQR